MRRAQIQEPFRTLFALVVVGLILFFGFRLFGDVAETSCQTDMTKFKVDMEHFLDDSAGAAERSMEKQLRVPCGADKVLFFDRDKQVLFDGFERYPEVENILGSQTDENMFLIKNGEIIQSLHLPNISIKVPYFLCAATDHNLIDLSLSADRNGKIDLRESGIGQSCTYSYVTPIELSVEDAVEVMYEIFKVNESALNQSIVDPMAVNLTRGITYEGNWTVINITKDTGNMTYYEMIPKCAMESFKAYQSAGLIQINGGGFVNLTDDPLIMWHLDDAKESIQYKIKGLIEPDCMRGHSPGLFGMALADTPYPGVSNSTRDELVEKRMELDSHLMYGMTGEAVAGTLDRVDEEVIDATGELEIVRKGVSQSSLSDSEMKNIDSAISMTIDSFENSPGEVPTRLDHVKTLLSSYGLSSLMTQKQEEEIERAAGVKDKKIRKEHVDTHETLSCSDSDSSEDVSVFGSCTDASLHRDICIGFDKVAQASCSAEGCAYTTVSTCASSSVCVNGRCVSNSTCIDDNSAMPPMMRVTFVGSSTTHTDKLYLNNTGQLLFDTSSTAGDSKYIPFTPGEELIFRLEVVDEGDTYYSGPPSRNNGQLRANVTSLGGDTYKVGWADSAINGYGDFEFKLNASVTADKRIMPFATEDVTFEAVPHSTTGFSNSLVINSTGQSLFPCSSVGSSASATLPLGEEIVFRMHVQGSDFNHYIYSGDKYRNDDNVTHSTVSKLGSKTYEVAFEDMLADSPWYDGDSDGRDCVVNVTADHLSMGNDGSLHLGGAGVSGENAQSVCFSDNTFHFDYCRSDSAAIKYGCGSQGCTPQLVDCASSGGVCDDGECVGAPPTCLVDDDMNGVVCYENGAIEELQECRIHAGEVQIKEVECADSGYCVKKTWKSVGHPSNYKCEYGMAVEKDVALFGPSTLQSQLWHEIKSSVYGHVLFYASSNQEIKVELVPDDDKKHIGNPVGTPLPQQTQDKIDELYNNIDGDSDDDVLFKLRVKKVGAGVKIEEDKREDDDVKIESHLKSPIVHSLATRNRMDGLIMKLDPEENYELKAHVKHENGYVNLKKFELLKDQEDDGGKHKVHIHTCKYNLSVAAYDKLYVFMKELYDMKQDVDMELQLKEDASGNVNKLLDNRDSDLTSAQESLWEDLIDEINASMQTIPLPTGEVKLTIHHVLSQDSIYTDEMVGLWSKATWRVVKDMRDQASPGEEAKLFVKMDGDTEGDDDD